MPARLVFQFPKTYDQAIMGQFLVALNQRLEEMENRLKGTAGGESAEVSTSSSRSITITDVVNNLSIGRGQYAEIAVFSANAALTGMTARDPGQIVVIKNSSVSTNSLPIVHDSTGSAAGNRFFMRNSADMVVPVNGARTFIYSQSHRGWIPISEVP